MSEEPDVNPINQQVWRKVFQEDDDAELQRKRNLAITQKAEEMKWLKEHNRKKYDALKEKQNRLRDLKKWFNCFDADGSGTISADELVDPLLSLGLAKTVHEVEKMIAEVDDSGDGELQFEEFVQLFGTNYESHPIVKMLAVLDSGAYGDPKLLSIQSLVARYRRMKLLEGLHNPLTEKNESVLAIRRAMEYAATNLEKPVVEEEQLEVTPEMIIHKSKKLRKKIEQEVAPPPVSYIRSYVKKGYYGKIPPYVVVNQEEASVKKVVGYKSMYKVRVKSCYRKSSVSKNHENCDYSNELQYSSSVPMLPLLPDLTSPSKSPPPVRYSPNETILDQNKADKKKDFGIDRNKYKKTFSKKALKEQDEQLRLQKLDFKLSMDIKESDPPWVKSRYGRGDGSWGYTTEDINKGKFNNFGKKVVDDKSYAAKHPLF